MVTRSIHCSGITTASDFPVTKGAYRTQYEGNFTPNVFVTRFNAQGSALISSPHPATTGSRCLATR